MLRALFFLSVILALNSCGVKLPPLAPETPVGAPSPKNLNCSPTQDDCDAQDPNYRPRRR